STLSYVLGNGADINYNWRPEIVTDRQFNPGISANRNVIFIGQGPSELQNSASSDKNYVTLLPSPWTQGYAVMIIGDQNRQDGFSPAAVFGDPVRSVLLHGNTAYLDQQVTLPPQPFPNDFSFEDLGYLDRTIRGIGQQNLIYRLYIPYDIDPALVKLNLGLVHSPDLDIQNSSFTVYLNGFSIAGILPTARSSTGEPITVGLPASKFRPGINFIRIRFDLHVPHSSCERAPESVWATVLNNSTMEITYRNRPPIPSLKNFPLPFSDYPGFVYVLPDQHNQDDLINISRLSFMIGASEHLLNYPPQAMTASDFMQKKSDYRNAILVGLPWQNSATMNTNDLLPQPFTQDGVSLEDGYGIYLPTSNKDASLGLMQLIPSPWVKGGTVLVLTGNDQQGLDWTWDIILNPLLRDQFTGNLMVVGSANRSQASGVVSTPESPLFLFQQIADASNIPIIGPILQRGGKAFLIPALVAVGIALLLIFLVLWIIRLARNRVAPDTIEKTDEREKYE
ncbi:MAG TPA: cellulose biosynthesis cyclic di-GMP-binding regulatory protein BcsB, partial [Anaerolineales bacterium]|nr:cellulose biosynthesis cyclic di-GMP-binding regulatory protein BcsB [Anaerolineales bacterium]